LVFTHPVTGKEIDLHAPLPKDFTKMIAQLRKACVPPKVKPQVLAKPGFHPKQ
jgi:23S rRNA pseudouridine1911/1915/1917 synthase